MNSATNSRRPLRSVRISHTAASVAAGLYAQAASWMAVAERAIRDGDAIIEVMATEQADAYYEMARRYADREADLAAKPRGRRAA